MSTWIYISNGKQFGPFNDAAIREYIATRCLPTDKFMASGMDKWLFGSEVEDFLRNTDQTSSSGNHEDLLVFCPSCATQAVEKAVYCHRCGTPIFSNTTESVNLPHAKASRRMRQILIFAAAASVLSLFLAHPPLNHHLLIDRMADRFIALVVWGIIGAVVGLIYSFISGPNPKDHGP